MCVNVRVFNALTTTNLRKKAAGAYIRKRNDNCSALYSVYISTITTYNTPYSRASKTIQTRPPPPFQKKRIRMYTDSITC